MNARRQWLICPACEGEGTCVNPAIDAGGLSAEDFHSDPDFAEAYMGGVFDQSCRACNGTGKVTVERDAELRTAAEDRRLAAAEDGRWEDYRDARDFRWGA